MICFVVTVVIYVVFVSTPAIDVDIAATDIWINEGSGQSHVSDG